MLNTDPCNPRPHLVSSNSLAHAVTELRAKTGSAGEVWRLLTERFVVDLDAAAKLLPKEEPETVWLPARA